MHSILWEAEQLSQAPALSVSLTKQSSPLQLTTNEHKKEREKDKSYKEWEAEQHSYD